VFGRGIDHYWLYEPNEAVHELLPLGSDDTHTPLRRFNAPGDVPEGSVSTG